MLEYSPGQLTETAAPERVARTVALLRRRGYALSPARLAAMCAGGALQEHEVRRVAAASPNLTIVHDLVVERDHMPRLDEIRGRANGHDAASPGYLAMTRQFVRALVAAAPFVRSVWIAGSLASGGFRDSDDVDLNLVVDDGHRHLAYVAINALGLVHGMRHRGKPVDDLTRRPTNRAATDDREPHPRALATLTAGAPGRRDGVRADGVAAGLRIRGV